MGFPYKYPKNQTSARGRQSIDAMLIPLFISWKPNVSWNGGMTSHAHRITLRLSGAIVAEKH